MDINEFRRLFSVERLGSYIIEGNLPSSVIERYQWNIKLSEAMIPPLHYLEVLLRNRLDSLIKTIFHGNWLLNPTVDLQLKDFHQRSINDIKQKLSKEANKPIQHGDILAQLNFGFWCTFFEKR